jgi:hypothetical protein
MRAQCRYVVVGEDPRDPRVKLSTGLNKSRRWPRENLNKTCEWKRSGFPGPVLWKERERSGAS